MDPVTATTGVAVATEAGLVGTVIAGLTGPGGLVVLVALVLVGAYLLLVKHVLPQQEKHISQLLESAKEDRTTFREAFSSIGLKLDRVTDRLEHLEDRVSVVLKKE